MITVGNKKVILSGQNFNVCVVSNSVDPDLLHLAYRRISPTNPTTVQTRTYRLSDENLGPEIEISPSDGVDPALFWFADNLWCIWSNNGFNLLSAQSIDNGATWSTPEVIANMPGAAGHHFEDVSILLPGDGRIVVSAEYELVDTEGSFLTQVVYDGNEWGDVDIVVGDGVQDYEGAATFAWEGRLLMVGADNRNGLSSYENNEMYLYESFDFGITWIQRRKLFDQKSHVEYSVSVVDSNLYLTTTRNFNSSHQTADCGVHDLGRLDKLLLSDAGWVQEIGTLTTGEGYADLREGGRDRGFVSRPVEAGESLDFLAVLESKGSTAVDLRLWFGDDAQNHYVVIAQTNTVFLFVRVGGNYSQLQTAPIDLELNRPYAIRAKISDGLITVYIDNDEVLEASDSTFDSIARVGFGCSGTANPSQSQPVRCHAIAVADQWRETWEDYATFYRLGSGAVVFATEFFEAANKTFVGVEDRDNQEFSISPVAAKIEEDNLDGSSINATAIAEATSEQIALDIEDRGEAWSDALAAIASLSATRTVDRLELADGLLASINANATGLATANGLAELATTIANLEVTRNVYLRRITEKLEIVRGDCYDGTNAEKLSFKTDQRYIDEAAQIMIFNGDEVLATGTGTANEFEVVIDGLEAEFDSSLFRGNPRCARLSYAVVVGTKDTVRHGPCIVDFRPDIDNDAQSPTPNIDDGETGQDGIVGPLPPGGSTGPGGADAGFTITDGS